jgi:predicted dehydrogenase
MIRVGIVGIGFMGMVHYLNYRRLRGAKVVALCDTNAKRLTGDWRDIRGNFGPPGERMDLAGIRTYLDPNELLADADVDLVDITLPPSLHADIACRAFVHGKNVFCEKPMALSSSDCQKMARAAARSGRNLYVGHVLPYFPEYAWALKTIRSEKFGRLLGGTFKRVIADPKWLRNYWNAEMVGGPMLDLHVHDAHFIRLLFGMPASVVTYGTAFQGLPKYWHSLFEFSGNQYVVEATSGTIDQQGRPFLHGFEIRLEKATLAFEFAVLAGKGSYLLPPTIFDSRGDAKQIELKGGDPMDAFHAELQEVVRCVSANRTSDILGGELASDAIRICNMETKSLASGRPVRT